MLDNVIFTSELSILMKNKIVRHENTFTTSVIYPFFSIHIV